MLSRIGTRFAMIAVLATVGLVMPYSPHASAHAPSGAIFTTLPDGSEVNFNHYRSKEDVYLDGGPGPGAPQTAAGLDDGRYVFQVTDPSGKVLLSTDPARCRQFDVALGVISAVVDTDCEHLTGTDVDHNATTVQLFPYLDTPNNGGVYKVWVSFLNDFLAGCASLGVADGLSAVDCGGVGGNRHGFVPRHSKTDNFKVGEQPIVEIDTLFRQHDGRIVTGVPVTWTDSLGASNQKWGYISSSLNLIGEAHVEAVEVGTHTIRLADAPTCLVHEVYLDGRLLPSTGAQTVSVAVKQLNRSRTFLIEVDCH